MVPDSRTPSRPDSLRPRVLNEPRPVAVQERDGLPIAIMLHGRQHRIATINDTWIIEDEWWRAPIDRQYFAVLLANGQAETLYHDRLSGNWYAQAY